MSYVPIRDNVGDAQKIDVDSATEGADTVLRQAVSLYAKDATAADTAVAVDSSGNVKVYVSSGAVQLSAGIASVGKLGANSGVNIGTVAITGVLTTQTSGTSKVVACQKIDSAISGTLTVLASPGASSKLYVLGWFLKAEGAVDVKWKGDGGTGEITGPIEMADGDVIQHFFGDYSVPFENNEAFQLVTDAAIQVSGYVLYYTV